MEASCGSSCYKDQATENFTFEVPNENSANEVLFKNNLITEGNENTTNSIVIEEIDVDDEKCESTEDNCISIVSDDEEQVNLEKDPDSDIAALTEGINNEIISNHPKYFQVETNVIDLEKDTDCSIVDVAVNHNGETENGILDALIKKCLHIKNSVGMPRVINRTLLVIYKNVDEQYKNSEEFKKAISDTIEKLNAKPERKFSHIKNLCDNMKLHVTKKRVPFITLDKDEEHSSTIPKKRRKVDDIIDLDDDTDTAKNVTSTQECSPIGKVYPLIDLDSTDEEVFEHNDEISLNKENTSENSRRVRKSPNQSPEKKRIFNHIRKYKNRKLNTPKQAIKKAPKITQSGFTQLDNPKSCLSKESDLINSIIDPEMLLEPRMSVSFEISESNQAMIEKIENRIAGLKLQLDNLEEAEVLIDSLNSPYIFCEKIKSTILQLYNQLCRLTGSEVTKRHKVRLQVVPGHPEGPVRCLEEFLNENIDKEGNPPFPDFTDVLQCVNKANLKYNMYWTPAQILNEAQALFTQFGQSMQKRRQNREWKDLMSLVKTEIVDPADEDPVLQARLEENKLIAKQNELDVLERYAKMEQGSDPGLRLNVNESEDSDEDTDALNETSAVGVEQLKITNVSSNAEDSTVHVLASIDDNTVVILSENIDKGPTLEYVGENITVKPQVTNPNTHFVSEYSKFITNLDREAPKTRPTYDTSRNIMMQDARVDVTKCSETDLKAARIAEDIITLVKSGSNTNLASDKSNHVNASFNPVVRLTNLNLNNLAQYNEPTISVHSALISTNSSVSEDFNANKKNIDSVATNKEMKRSKELETSENVANVLKEDNEIKVEDCESIVKPEPLDIPSMLKELGEDYTATIFDIEDPFLVIEISDSSESEDDSLEDA